MANPLPEARLQMLLAVQELGALKYRLLGVQASLPASVEETDPMLEADQLDEASDLRTTIACVLNDYLIPAEEILGETFALGSEQPLDSRSRAGGEGKGGA